MKAAKAEAESTLRGKAMVSFGSGWQWAVDARGLCEHEKQRVLMSKICRVQLLGAQHERQDFLPENLCKLFAPLGMPFPSVKFVMSLASQS